MITKNFKESISMDESKLQVLKNRFPAAFDEKNPQPIWIKVNEGAFFTKLRATNSGTVSPYRDSMESVRSAPSPEMIQLQYRHVDSTGSQVIYSYSERMPKPLDTIGMHFEFDSSSGNIYHLKHDGCLFVRENLQLLYFLYFYCDKFENGECPTKMQGDTTIRYRFYMENENQSVRSKSVLSDAEWAIKLNRLGDDQTARILKGMFKPVSPDTNTNFNNLYDIMRTANKETQDHFEQLVKSTSPIKENGDVNLTTDEKTIGEWIGLWISNGKIICVKEKNEDFPKAGWYQRYADGEGDPNIWAKTPIQCKYDNSIEDQRIVLGEYLTINTDLFEKMKTRWKLDE